MMTADPLTDLFRFLIGDTGDYNRFGSAKYVSVVFYLLLLVAGGSIAWLNWSRDPSQRMARNVWVLLMRVAAGGMWFQGTIWKQPLPIADGFALLQIPVYGLEIFFTVSLTLGFAVRLSGVLAVLFTIQLWLGLYNDPTEWPWTYMAIIFAHGMFVVAESGRSLGLDHLLADRELPLFRRSALLSHAYRLAS